MKTRTIKQAVVLLSSAMLLAACGGGGGHTPARDASDSKRQSLLYAYPYNDQSEIATAAPVVLRFTSAVALADAEDAVTLHEGDAKGPTVKADYSLVDGEPRGLVLTPDEHLKPLTDYTVVVNDLKLARGTSANKTLHFTTRPLQKGPKELVVSSDQFEIQRQIPDTNKKTEPVMDFSTFRFQFTQPIDASTAHYGDAPASSSAPADTVKLTNADGDLVEATLLIDGPYMTVDPKPEYLKAGEQYTLTLSDELVSTYGEPFGGKEITFTPQDSSPRGEPAILVQRLTQDGTSRLTGKAINQVPVNGTLLGEDANVTQAESDAVEAELADVTVYPDVTPIRIPRGTTLGGSAIEKVLIGGQVDAGFGSGPVTMQFLSDATGYLVPNPYNSQRDDALRIVHLFMDVAIATEDPRANGGFTQDILHIELVGVADVDTQGGHLNIDAVSVVEPDILGQEYGYGLLSFQLQSYADQENPPQVAVDTTPPTLLSWMPGDNVDLQKPGDPMVLNFNEAIDPQSIDGNVRFYENGTEKEIIYHVDGAALVVKPVDGLRYSLESEEYEYQLVLGGGISDLSGNHYTPGSLPAFVLPTKVENKTLGGASQPVEDHSPVVVATYPGFPCPRTEMDLAAGDAGRCVDSFPGVSQADWAGLDLTAYDIKAEDDHFSIPKLPSNRPIVARFSKEIDADSVRLDSSFKVEKVDVTGNPIESVEGALEITKFGLKFYPEHPWDAGQLYRYTLGSNDDTSSSTADCDGSSAICDIDGLPLQTVWFANLDIREMSLPPGAPGEGPKNATKRLSENTTRKLATAGGPPMDIYFEGSEETTSILQVLSTQPLSDVNGNFIHEGEVPDLINMANGFMKLGNSGDAEVYEYDVEEEGGVGLPNSARVISLNPRGAPIDDNGQALAINGVSIGCGPDTKNDWDPDDTSKGFYSEPYDCPESQHTYLSGALVAEVTDKYIEGEGLEVKVWPAPILSTSLVMYSRVGALPVYIRSQTGPQFLRIRYAKDDSGNRSKPVTGYIMDGESGPVLNVNVDLYVDAPELTERLPVPGLIHNMLSLPITMVLSGPISFADDGRMVVDQINVTDTEIPFLLFGNVQSDDPPIDIPLSIGEGNNWLRYVSDPIK